MKNSNDKSKVAITKAFAARRQLDTAIRLYLAQDDELSVHTLAAAAFRILRDLQKHRDILHFPDLLRHGLWGLAEDYRKGHTESVPADLIELVKKIANLQERRVISQPSDIQGENELATEINLFTRLAKPSNFLKHADRDHKAILLEGDFDNEQIIQHACVSYMSLFRTLTLEMAVFTAYLYADEKNPFPDNPRLSMLVGSLRKIPKKSRMKHCLKMTRDLALRKSFDAAV